MVLKFLMCPLALFLKRWHKHSYRLKDELIRFRRSKLWWFLTIAANNEELKFSTFQVCPMGPCFGETGLLSRLRDQSWSLLNPIHQRSLQWHYKTVINGEGFCSPALCYVIFLFVQTYYLSTETKCVKYDTETHTWRICQRTDKGSNKLNLLIYRV